MADITQTPGTPGHRGHLDKAHVDKNEVQNIQDDYITPPGQMKPPSAYTNLPAHGISQGEYITPPGLSHLSPSGDYSGRSQVSPSGEYPHLSRVHVTDEDGYTMPDQPSGDYSGRSQVSPSGDYSGRSQVSPSGEYSHLSRGHVTDEDGYTMPDQPVYDVVGETAKVDPEPQNRSKICTRKTLAVTIVVLLMIILGGGGYGIYRITTGGAKEFEEKSTSMQGLDTTARNEMETSTVTTELTTTPKMTTILNPTSKKNITYKTTPRAEFSGSSSDIGRLHTPNYVAIDENLNIIYLTDTNNRRVCLFDMDLNPISCLSDFVSEQRHNDSLYFPWGLALTQYGEMVVTDGQRVMIFQVTPRNLTLIQLWGKRGVRGSGLGEFSHPAGVAVVGNLLYVADNWNNRIQVLNRNNPLDIWAWPSPDIWDWPGSSPGSVAVSPSTGHIYVGSQTIVTVLNSTGHYLRHLEAADLGMSIIRPVSVSVDSRDQLYISDYHNDCVHILTAGGVYLQTLGRNGTCQGCLMGPGGIAVHSITGDLVIPDWDFARSNIQIFEPKGL